MTMPPKEKKDEVIKIDPTGKEIAEKNSEHKSEGKKFQLRIWWKGLTKKQKILYLSLAGLTIILLIIGGIFIFKALGLGKWDKDTTGEKSQVSEEATPKEEPKDHESPLSGRLITKSEYEKIMQRRPMGVILENHVDARPQSGLNEADIVWEALAEGGISRFMAVYLENEPDKVGPVRSLRKYFLDWVSELRDGLIMHIGYAHTDNPDTNALGYVYTYDVKALGLFLSHPFWRVTTRLAPHNAYSSVKDLWVKAADKGWTGVIDLDRWQFKDPAKDNFGEVKEISFNWQGWGATDYSVKWTFDPIKNRYLREHNGVPHIEAQTDEQITAKNVVIQLHNWHYTVDTDGKSRLVYDLLGEGEAYVFIDGKVIEGKWKKADRVSRTKYYDENGKEIEFNRGRTWISVLPTGSEIMY